MTGEEDPSDPRSLAAQPKRHRLAVLLAGPAMNLLLALVLFSLAYVNGVPEATSVRVVVAQIYADTPAAEAGLQVDDVILEVDGIELEDVAHLREYDSAHKGQDVLMTLERDGAEIERIVRIGASDGMIGVATWEMGEDFVVRRWPLNKALGMGAEQFWFGVKQMFSLPAMLIRGQVSAEEVKPVGPVGISQLAGDAIKASSEQDSLFIVISFAGAISLALGLSNLLPLPALDGGRTLFVLLEALRGRRIDPVKESVFHLIGLALLLGLMLILTVQELINPVASPF
jgi:regulator of sigma E protease